MIAVYHRAMASSRFGWVPMVVLAAAVGVTLGLTIIDLFLAALLMARALKETTP